MTVTFREPWSDASVTVTQTFAEHLQAAKNYSPGHYNGGLDVAPIQPGKDVIIYSGADGDLIKVGWDPDGYGNYVRIRHAGGYESVYAHLRATTVKLGPIKAGDYVGIMGTTGNSTGIHLHFEVRLNGKPVDPELLIVENAPNPLPPAPPQNRTPVFPALPRMVVTAPTLRMRQAPGLSARELGWLASDTVLEVLRLVDADGCVWAQIGFDQFCAMSRGNKRYCEWIL